MISFRKQLIELELLIHHLATVKRGSSAPESGCYWCLNLKLTTLSIRHWQTTNELLSSSPYCLPHRLDASPSLFKNTNRGIPSTRYFKISGNHLVLSTFITKFTSQDTAASAEPYRSHCLTATTPIGIKLYQRRLAIGAHLQVDCS